MTEGISSMPDLLPHTVMTERLQMVSGGALMRNNVNFSVTAQVYPSFPRKRESSSRSPRGLLSRAKTQRRKEEGNLDRINKIDRIGRMIEGFICPDALRDRDR